MPNHEAVAYRTPSVSALRASGSTLPSIEGGWSYPVAVAPGSWFWRLLCPFPDPSMAGKLRRLQLEVVDTVVLSEGGLGEHVLADAAAAARRSLRSSRRNPTVGYPSNPTRALEAARRAIDPLRASGTIGSAGARLYATGPAGFVRCICSADDEELGMALGMGPGPGGFPVAGASL